MTETFLIETAEQLRVLADPLRQRLLQRFAQAGTVKEAAAALGEPLTKLYHHVDQLASAGLLRVVGERQRRATVERTFQAAAARFAVSPAAFGGVAGRAAERDRIARAAVEDLLSEAAPSEGAFRMLRGRARLSEEGRERIEAELSRMLTELADPDAPEIELMLMTAVRE